jgi:hypothetical protein
MIQLLCIMNVALPSEVFRACMEVASHHYLHNGDVCSYCEKHNHTCGTPLSTEAALEKFFEGSATIDELEDTRK